MTPTIEDEFANFYAQTYRNIPDRCEADSHFFDERRYLGFVCDATNPQPTRVPYSPSAAARARVAHLVYGR